MIVAEELKALDKAGLAAMPLGERAHDLGVVDQEGRVLAVNLDEVPNELVNQAWRRAWVCAVDSFLLAEFVEEDASLFSCESVTLGELNTENLFKALHHWDALERRSEVDLNNVSLVLGTVGMVLNFVRTMNLEDHLREHVLGELHQVVVVSIGPVKFAGSELRVVGEVNALITELLANLKHSVDASDNQHLKVELWGNSHEQLHIKIVVESLEGTSGGATWDHVHHRGLNLEEVTLAKEGANEVDDLITNLEDLFDMRVDDHVEVAVTVASVLRQGVLLYLVLSGKHVHAVGEDFNGGWAD